MSNASRSILTVTALGLLLLLAGCASKSAPEAMNDQAEPSSTKRATAPTKDEGKGGAGLVEYVEKPDVTVGRVGARWGLPLTEIPNIAQRREMAKQLDKIEKTRAKAKLPPPGRSYLYVAGPGLYAVLVLPSKTEAGKTHRADVFLWDYTNKREPCKVSLELKSAKGELALLGQVVRRGPCWERAYEMKLAKAGPFGVRLTLTRKKKQLLQRTVATVSVTTPPEQP